MPQFDALITQIDDINRQDPNQDQGQPKELLYSQRMSAALATFAPDASEALKIAAHGQHIGRWEIPRSDYPKTRAGYLQWRRALGKHHAERVAVLMPALDYSDADIERVKSLLTKSNLRQDEEVQTLEDVICLVFIEHYLEEFGASQELNKLISIIQKTWNKMSERGHQQALKLNLSPAVADWVQKALA